MRIVMPQIFSLPVTYSRYYTPEIRFKTAVMLLVVLKRLLAVPLAKLGG